MSIQLSGSQFVLKLYLNLLFVILNISMLIPSSEYTLEFARSGGPGGQNVNKVSSKAQLRFNVGASLVLSEDQKNQVRVALKNRLTNSDEILVVAEDERSQIQNRELVVTRFEELIAQALHVPKKRRPTRPTRSSKEKRLQSKRIISERKQSRQIRDLN